MAVEKVGIYRRWLEPVPVENGKPIPKSQWPKKRRHSWTVRWFGTTGRRYSKDFKTKKLADRYARDLQGQIGAGKQDRPERITLQEFLAEHARVMQGQVAHATLVDQNRALRFFAKYIGATVALQKVKPRHAESFVAYRLTCGIAVSTVNKDIRTLKRVFNLAVEPRGCLLKGQNPFGAIRQRKKAPKVIRYVSVGEYRLLIKGARNLWWRAVISIAYGSGLRKGEILNLTWADIDFKNQRIHVQTKPSSRRLIEWEPKDHENRVVPVSEASARLLADLQAESVEQFAYVFISPGRFKRIRERMEAGRWNPKSEVVNNTVKNFNGIRRNAGIPDCTLHDLRRSAITNWAQHLPIQVVQQLAGHSSIATTRKYYLAIRPADVVSAASVINQVLASTPGD